MGCAAPAAPSRKDDKAIAVAYGMLPVEECCRTMAMRSRRWTETPLAGALLAVLALCACSPTAPEGVDEATLDDAVSKAIGDPTTCVMIAERGTGKVVYRYNTNTMCDRDLPSCEGPGTRKVADLVKLTAKDGQPRTLSCDSTADASRGVGWAAGPVAGKPLVYAAVMEGDRAFPGRMMAERLTSAFRKAGLSPRS
jgi:hypothetical protein